MIDHLDAVIRATVVVELPQLSGKVGFQPPDDAWRQRVGAGTGVWINCALVDLRENRERRTTGVRVERDPVRRVRPPFLLQCHYLLSAWNSAKDSDAVEASVHEHALLGRVIAALHDRSPLTPAEVLLPVECAVCRAPGTGLCRPCRLLLRRWFRAPASGRRSPPCRRRLLCPRLCPPRRRRRPRQLRRQ